MNLMYEPFFKGKFNEVANQLNYLELDSSQLKNHMKCIHYAKNQSPY